VSWQARGSNAGWDGEFGVCDVRRCEGRCPERMGAARCLCALPANGASLGFLAREKMPLGSTGAEACGAPARIMCARGFLGRDSGAMQCAPLHEPALCGARLRKHPRAGACQRGGAGGWRPFSARTAPPRLSDG